MGAEPARLAERDEVDRMIDAGAPLSAVWHHFRNRRTAALHYAQRRAETFAAHRAVGPCHLCGGGDELRVSCLEWEVPVRSLLLASIVQPLSWLVLFAGRQLIRFRTHHVLCAACRRTVEEKHPLRRFLQLTGAALLLVGVAMAAIGVLQLRWGNVRGEDVVHFRRVAMGGAACAVAGALCLLGFSRIVVPDALRRIVPPLFELRGAEQFDPDRHDGYVT